jgi:hypothetical protein
MIRLIFCLPDATERSAENRYLSTGSVLNDETN